MTNKKFEFKNEFLDKILNSQARAHNNALCGEVIDGIGQTGIYGDRLVYGDIKTPSVHQTMGGPCYGELDSKGPIFKDSFVWCPINRMGNDFNLKQLEARIEFAKSNFFSPDSPWANIIKTMECEMFEGYDTPEERAELVSKFGWVFGPNSFHTCTKVHLGAFMVFTRRQNEYQGVRESLKLFLEDPVTRDLPLQWNVFAAHHIMTMPKTKTVKGNMWTNGHSPFFPDLFPLTAAGFVTQKIELGNPKDSWYTTKGKGTWQSNNSDRIFPELFQKDPKYEKVQYKPFKFASMKYGRNGYEAPVYGGALPFSYPSELVGTVEWQNLMRSSPEFNLWHWENRVKPYVNIAA